MANTSYSDWLHLRRPTPLPPTSSARPARPWVKRGSDKRHTASPAESRSNPKHWTVNELAADLNAPGIYVVQLIGLPDFVKVGASKALDHRLSSFRTSSPQGVALVGYLKTGKPYGLENAIHNDLRGKGLQTDGDGGREWFRAEPELWSTLEAHGIERCWHRYTRRARLNSEPRRRRRRRDR